MDTREIEYKLAKKCKYKKLDDHLSYKFRLFYSQNIPSFLNVFGDSEITLCTIKGTPVIKGYDRIVIGDYGAFIEFSRSNIIGELFIQKGQEFRLSDDPRYSNVKYLWLTCNDDSNIKIYHQLKTVTYADYKPLKYYVSVHEVKSNECKL